MKRILWTFGLATLYKGKCIITNSEDFNSAMYYVYNKYGQNNIGFNYLSPYVDLEEIIQKNNYEIIEEITL